MGFFPVILIGMYFFAIWQINTYSSSGDNKNINKQPGTYAKQLKQCWL